MKKMMLSVAIMMSMLTVSMHPAVFAEETDAVVMQEETVTEDTANMLSAEDTALDTDEAVYDADIVASGTLAYNLKWSLDSDGLLNIWGNGEMQNYYGDMYVPWYKRSDDIYSIYIGDGVASIGDYAFYNCKNLTSVALSNSVVSIGHHAFTNCRALTSITIPDSVTSIGSSAFACCHSLTSLTVPGSVTSIGSSAFSYCSNLTSINISDGLTSIGIEAFRECSSLTSINIPDGVTSIGMQAFKPCSSLTSITIPSSVAEFGTEAFSGCSSLASITIPDSMTSIGNSVFAGCSSLTSITIPDSVTSIDYAAFSCCSGLTSITFGDGVKSIGSYAFRSCSSLTSITLPNSLTSIDGVAFSWCSSLTSITIPNSVTSIGSGAFSWCSSLTSITIPNSVTSIDSGAFYFCTKLTHIHIPYSKTAEEYTGKGDLPINNSYYYVLSEDGHCYDSKCPMGLYKAGMKTPAKPTVTVKTAFGGKTMTFNCADKDAEIYYNIGSSNITTSCKKVANGGTVFFDTAMAKPVYFKAYMYGKWSTVSKNGLNNVQIAKPLCVQSGAKSKNDFKVYTQTKDSYIVYTLDGSVPAINEGTQKLTVKNGRIVWGTTAVINIPKGRTIKAIAIRCGLVTSDVMTYTNK
ncbi:MAG: leucine-rich repeat protein [Oscillospiraceae bacterium]|nr:leucine-rich repeat protein [Oscillospiraceae bacterium]